MRKKEKKREEERKEREKKRYRDRREITRAMKTLARDVLGRVYSTVGRRTLFKKSPDQEAYIE